MNGTLVFELSRDAERVLHCNRILLTFDLQDASSVV
jgi:hypothetical protein